MHYVINKKIKRINAQLVVTAILSGAAGLVIGVYVAYLVIYYVLL